MAQKEFRSKVDGWFRLLLSGIAFSAVGIGIALYRAVPGTESALALAVCVLSALMIAWILVDTGYVITRTELRIRSGPFRWRIPRERITAVNESRTLLSGPALSLDRLQIRMGKWRSIVVSPEDKAGFRRALGK